MLPLPCMLVCSSCYAQTAHETSGAASTRSSLRPLISGRKVAGKPRAKHVARSRNYVRVIASAAKQSMSRHNERMDCFAALAMTWRELSSPVDSSGPQERHCQTSAHKSCRVSLPCGIADRAGAFFAGVSPPVSAITETDTTRSMIAWTSLRSHCPSESFVSRSFSRIV
jgi:hypothetical protein